MRRVVVGYTDMGRIRIPVLPTQSVLTDRADGTRYLLSHKINDPDPVLGTKDRFALNTTFNTREPYRVFPAGEGPILKENPAIRLLVRSGRLGYEVVTLPVGIQDQDQQRVLTRRLFENQVFEVIVPDTVEPWKFDGDELGFEKVD